MDSYVTGATIKGLREARGLTQAELAGKIDVSSKTISKWETGKGLPDISVMELLSGGAVTNRNKSANLLRSRFYVCPICGNVIHAMGAAVVSCCGITLPALDAEAVDEAHTPVFEAVEDETYVVLNHPMTKAHYISFLAYVTSDTFQMVKLYPEGSAACRLRFRGHGDLYLCCNRHGLMKMRV